MNRFSITKVMTAAAAAALSVALLAGCMAQNPEEAEKQAENRQFMAQVNQTMVDLGAKLEDFNEAVANGDVVNMRTQADNAFKVLDSLDALEAPEDLADVKQDYVDGAAELKDALTAYVDLYTEIDSATEAAPFNWSTYNDRMDSIKKSYDDGVAKLQAGDDTAAGKE